MKLDKIEVKPENVVPDIRYFGETNFDEKQLKSVEDVKNIALQAISTLGIARYDTSLRPEQSVKEIYKACDRAIKDIKEYMEDFEMEATHEI